MSSIPFNKYYSIDIYSLSQIINAFGKGKRQPQFLSGIATLAKKKLSHDEGTARNFRFMLYFWKNLAKIDPNNDERYTSSIKFLTTMMAVARKSQFEELLSHVSKSSLTFMMISIFGGTKDIGTCSNCIASLFTICDGKSLYIVHVAVTDSSYLETDFGAGADKRPFRNRGIAKLLVGVIQSYLKCISQSSNVICHCSVDNEVDYGSMWKSLGFEVVNECQENYEHALERLQPFAMYTDQMKSFMMIDQDVNQYNVAGELTSGLLSSDKHKLFQEPFITHHVEFNLLEYTQHQLANFLFSSESDICNTIGKAHLPLNSLANQLLKVYQYKKSCIMLSAENAEVNQELKKIMVKNHFIPETVVDYLFLHLMMQFDDVYAISLQVVSYWYRTSYQEFIAICQEHQTTHGGGNAFEASFEYDLTECFLCELEATNPSKNLLFLSFIKIIGFWFIGDGIRVICFFSLQTVTSKVCVPSPKHPTWKSQNVSNCYLQILLCGHWV